MPATACAESQRQQARGRKLERCISFGAFRLVSASATTCHIVPPAKPAWTVNRGFASGRLAAGLEGPVPCHAHIIQLAKAAAAWRWTERSIARVGVQAMTHRVSHPSPPAGLRSPKGSFHLVGNRSGWYEDTINILVLRNPMNGSEAR